MSSDNYLVLARKYRSQTFAELVGQDALVRTLQNAIENNRIHHAYVLTGIRGTGKTSTARLLAKALNCENGPATTWAEDDPQAKAITEGNHVDVLEFDAASHTGVDDVRDLFEGVAYAPVQGRFKVYIIDEVHMLSKQAFNALLKTLEEPPEHVKFIFATTEVNKIPVTVLSRCQRFDLKRITADELAEHYTNILKKENIEAEADAIHLIAKAADGSARDGLSLLDQAIALSAGKKIGVDVVAGMLGLADRAKTYTLFEALMAGDAEAAIATFDDMYNFGQDPQMALVELMEIAHLVTRLKVVKGLKESPHLTELERSRAVPQAEKLGMEALTRVYQALLNAAVEVKTADRPAEATSMAILRLCHLARLPSVADMVENGPPPTAKPGQGGGTSTTKTGQDAASAAPAPQQLAPPPTPPWEEAQPAPANPPKKVEPQSGQPAVTCPTLQNWADLVAVLKQSQPGFAAALATQVRCHTFSQGSLNLEITKGLLNEAEITNDLRKHLHQQTGKMWEIKIDQPLQTSPHAPQTLAEKQTADAAAAVAEAAQTDDVQKLLAAFPGAEVVSVETIN